MNTMIQSRGTTLIKENIKAFVASCNEKIFESFDITLQQNIDNLEEKIAAIKTMNQAKAPVVSSMMGGGLGMGGGMGGMGMGAAGGFWAHTDANSEAKVSYLGNEGMVSIQFRLGYSH